MKISHIYLDMDGVLCDFVGAALRIHKRLDALDHWPAGEWDIAKVLGISTDEFWAPIDHHAEHFWAGLEPYPWLNNLVNLLESTGAPITIASSPSYDPYSAAGKLMWLKKHLPQFKRRYLLGGEKHLLARPNAVLIDDNDQGVYQFHTAGGWGITFPQPWNQLSFVGESVKVEMVKRSIEAILASYLPARG
jgi:hypothetical protein